jgi:hypothetical protein
MQIIGTNIVRGTANPGLEVEFRGEGGESVTIQLKGDGIADLSDEEAISRAKEVLTEVIRSESGDMVVAK